MPSSQVGSSPPGAANACGVAGLGRGELHVQVALAAQLRDRGLGVVERLAVLAVLVLDRRDALALLRAGDDHGRLAGGGDRLGVGGGDLLHVVAVDLDRVPAERLGARP